MQGFEDLLLRKMTKEGWDGSEEEDNLQWTFAGALFYSIIVITTIGESIAEALLELLAEYKNGEKMRDKKRKENTTTFSPLTGKLSVFFTNKHNLPFSLFLFLFL